MVFVDRAVGIALLAGPALGALETDLAIAGAGGGRAVGAGGPMRGAGQFHQRTVHAGGADEIAGAHGVPAFAATGGATERPTGPGPDALAQACGERVCVAAAVAGEHLEQTFPGGRRTAPGSGNCVAGARGVAVAGRGLRPLGPGSAGRVAGLGADVCGGGISQRRPPTVAHPFLAALLDRRGGLDDVVCRPVDWGGP